LMTKREKTERQKTQYSFELAMNIKMTTASHS